MIDILELNARLMKNRSTEDNDNDNSYTRYKARIASRNKDIDMLLRTGSSPCQVSEILMVHPEVVKARVAAIERDNEDRQRFLSTGVMPGQQGGYVAIVQ